MKRAILISGKAQLNQELKSILPQVNCKIMASTDNGMEGLRLIHRFEPDLVFMGWDLRGLCSSEVLQNLVVQHLCPTIVILTQEEHHFLAQVVDEDAHHVVLYPWRVFELAAAIQLAERRFNAETEHAQQVQRLEEELKTRKLIFQAMLILIQNCNFSEQTAYTALRNQAMSSRKPLRSVAQDVLRGLWLPENCNE